MQRALSPAWLDGLFEQQCQRQYTRERLFSTEVDLMARVAWGLRPSLHAAVQASDTLKVSRQALYEKVNPPSRRGAAVGAGLRGAADAVLEPLMLQQPSWGGGLSRAGAGWAPLAARQKRLKPPRAFEAQRCPACRWVCTRRNETWW
jgi:hypothetical protein